LPWFLVFFFFPCEAATGVAKKGGVAKKEGIAKRKRRQEEGVAKRKRRQEEGVAKRKRRQEEGVAKKGSVAKVEGVAQAQAPPRNMTVEKRTAYEVCAKVKRRYRNQAWYSRVKFTSNVRDKWE